MGLEVKAEGFFKAIVTFKNVLLKKNKNKIKMYYSTLSNSSVSVIQHIPHNIFENKR